MIDSWNAAVLNDQIKRQNIPALLDKVETGTWNLIRTPYYHGNRTLQGVKFTINDDASVTATGTATQTVSYNVKRYTENFKLPVGNYKLKGCPADGSTTTYSLRVGIIIPPSTSITWLGYDVGNGFEFSLTDEYVLQVSIQIYNGYTISDGGLTFRPEIDVVELPLCSETTAGNYFLKATVDSDGVITYSWEELT